MTEQQREALCDARDGLEAALEWLEADLRRLERALNHGIPLEVIGALNRIAMQGREG